MNTEWRKVDIFALSMACIETAANITVVFLHKIKITWICVKIKCSYFIIFGFQVMTFRKTSSKSTEVYRCPQFNNKTPEISSAIKIVLSNH